MREQKLSNPIREQLERPKGKSEHELLQAWEDLVSQNNDVIENDKDGIFTSLVASVRSGWETLAPTQKSEITAHVAKLVDALRHYHDTYVNLKRTSDAQRGFHFDDIEKYQETVKKADQQERIVHNTFLDSFNILSRRMKEFGLDNSWRGMNVIYDADYWTMREKVKLWMFRVFNEEIDDRERNQ